MLCQVERRVTVTHGSLNIATGAITTGTTETVVRECGTPIFGDTGRKAGVCRSCRTGWEAEGNRPTERGREQIAAALAKLQEAE
jgi:hypothetical protein